MLTLASIEVQVPPLYAEASVVLNVVLMSVHACVCACTYMSVCIYLSSTNLHVQILMGELWLRNGITPFVCVFVTTVFVK